MKEFGNLFKIIIFLIYVNLKLKAIKDNIKINKANYNLSN